MSARHDDLYMPTQDELIDQWMHDAFRTPPLWKELAIIAAGLAILAAFFLYAVTAGRL